MKVRYGFDQYDQSYVNINPSKKKYIFDSPEGTDLAIPLEKIPEFWRKRIVELQENIHFTDNQGTQGSPLLLDVINPWRAKSRAEIRLAVIYRRFLYSSIGSFLRKTADIGKNLLRSAILTVKRV